MKTRFSVVYDPLLKPAKSILWIQVPADCKTKTGWQKAGYKLKDGAKVTHWVRADDNQTYTAVFAPSEVEQGKAKRDNGEYATARQLEQAFNRLKPFLDDPQARLVQDAANRHYYIEYPSQNRTRNLSGGMNSRSEFKRGSRQKALERIESLIEAARYRLYYQRKAGSK